MTGVDAEVGVEVGVGEGVGVGGAVGSTCTLTWIGVPEKEDVEVASGVLACGGRISVFCGPFGSLQPASRAISRRPSKYLYFFILSIVS